MGWKQRLADIACEVASATLTHAATTVVDRLFEREEEDESGDAGDSERYERDRPRSDG